MTTILWMTIICCITIVLCRWISVSSYNKVLKHQKYLYNRENPEPVVRQKSPYALHRTMHSKKHTWGYCIKKNGAFYTDPSGYYEFFDNLESAKETLWILEDIGNYERTEFRKLQDDPGTS